MKIQISETTQKTRFYRDKEDPMVGDIICLFEGAFGAGIITKIQSSGKEDDPVVTIHRPHASCRNPCPQLAVGIETLEMNVSRLRNYPVYVTGDSGRIDNRS